MDNRFDWFSELNSKELDCILSKVTDYLDQNRSRRGVNPEQLRKIKISEYKVTKQFLSALYASYYTLPIASHKVSLPLTSGFYTNTEYAYRTTRKVYQSMISMGWIDSEKGNEISGYTRIWCVGELEGLFCAIGFKWMPQSILPAESLIILRDRDPNNPAKKITCEIPDTDAVRHYRQELFRFNQFITQHCLALDLSDEQLNSLPDNQLQQAGEPISWDDQKLAGIDFSRIQLTRIFARQSMFKGGRFYRGWWQSLPSIYRPHITIDGYKTCEIDFSGVAIYIMYAEKGYQFPHDRDPYDIGLENWKGDIDPRRKLIKRFFNAKINDESGRYRLVKEDQDLLGINHHELLDRILKSHGPIADMLQSGIGIETQFTDSQIAQYIMTEMTKRGIVVLPIHDSFIVRVGYETDLREVMLQAFNYFTKMEGQVTVDYPRLPEHFGLSIKEYEEEENKLMQDPSHGIVGVDEVLNQVIERRSTIMDSYIGSWYSKCIQKEKIY